MNKPKKEKIREERPPIEWYEARLNDNQKEINRLDAENKQLKDVVVYLILRIKDQEDALNHWR